MYMAHHRSNDDCLEGKRENYQVSSVQYCVQKLCTVQCTHTYDMNKPNSYLLVRFSFSVIILCYSLFVYVCFCVIVFQYCAKILARKNVSEVAYFVSSGT